MITILYVVLCVILLWLPSFIIFLPKYKYYKATYLAIKNKEYVLFLYGDRIIYFRRPKDLNKPIFANCPEIHYFKDNSSIKMLDNVYLHRDIGFDPYSLYCFNKIKNQIIFNSMSVEDLRDYKLKQLNIK